MGLSTSAEGVRSFDSFRRVEVSRVSGGWIRQKRFAAKEMALYGAIFVCPYCQLRARRSGVD